MPYRAHLRLQSYNAFFISPNFFATKIFDFFDGSGIELYLCDCNLHQFEIPSHFKRL
nr:MAG TPA: hypothetical protein [Caudoviricetes sp.]